MIILFILVGLIYDWGGIKDHPGPVRKQVGSPALIPTHTSGALQFPKRTSVRGRIFQLCTNVCVRVLLFRRRRTRRHRRWRVGASVEISAECRESDVFPHRTLLCPYYPHDRVVYQLAGSDVTQGGQ